MSFHFSVALVAAFSEANSSAGAPSAPSKSTLTPEPSSPPDKTTARSPRFPSGMTSEPFEESRGMDWWISSLVDSPAKTSAQPAKEPASTVPAAAYGANLPESFARWDRATSSWRTPQCSLLADLDAFSETWPRWGMMRAGECSVLTMPALLTSETGSGLWPTIRSSDGERGGRGDLIQAIRGNPNSHYKLYPNLWPTLRASANENRQTKPTPSQLAGKHGWSLCAAVNAAGLLPTLTVHGNYNQKGMSKKSGNGLATAMRLLPTMTAQDAKNNGPKSQMEGNSLPLNAIVGGPLNPDWCEWLMGFPIGWTDCAASAMPRFQQWCHSHGILFQPPTPPQNE